VKTRQPPLPTNCDVSENDLNQLGVLHNILTALNDEYASVSKLAMLTAYSPVLTARVMRQAKSRSASIDTLSAALQLIGNRGLEKVLLEYLEDLTTLKAEREEDP
jgi:HD-like signal output (HDOD) protein